MKAKTNMRQPMKPILIHTVTPIKTI